MPEQVKIVNIPDDIYEEARIIAIKQKRSFSDVVRELIDQWVKNQKGEKKSSNASK